MQDLIRSGPNYWRHLVLVRPVRPSQNPMGAESRPLAEGGKAAMQVKVKGTAKMGKSPKFQISTGKTCKFVL